MGFIATGSRGLPPDRRRIVRGRIVAGGLLLALLVLALAVGFGFRRSVDLVDELDRNAERTLVAHYLDWAGRQRWRSRRSS